jgi:hypothetical protein
MQSLFPKRDLLRQLNCFNQAGTWSRKNPLSKEDAMRRRPEASVLVSSSRSLSRLLPLLAPIALIAPSETIAQVVRERVSGLVSCVMTESRP